MGVGYDIGINLGSALMGAALGVGWTNLREIRRYRSHHEFWRFLQRPTVFVVGELESGVLLNTLSSALERMVVSEEERESLVESIVEYVKGQEISGLMGRGDFDSMVNMVAKLAKLKLTVEPCILHPSQVGDRRVQNLVLIGGSDVNSLTRALSPQLGCRLEAVTNAQGRNVVRDTRLGGEYSVNADAVPNERGEIVKVDYGVLARGRNPENSRSEVLLIAGAHGLGTLAAAEVSLGDRYQKRLCRDLKEYRGSFECLVSYEHVDGGPSGGRTTMELEFSRRMVPGVAAG